MEVRNIRVVDQPERGTRRLQADVIFTGRRSGQETVWLEVDKAHGDALSSRGDPWLCYMLPLAALHRDPVIRVEGAASRQLIENLPGIVAQWHAWYPKLLGEIAIEADEVTDAPERQGTETGLFFSGGVDSWFSLLHEELQGTGFDTLVAVMGWDIPLSNNAAVESMIRSHTRAVTELGKKLVVVKTGMRDGRFGERKWGPLTHGAALAMVAHALSKEFSRLTIAATRSNDILGPWGSHPDTDPLFSSDVVEIVHHTPEFNRVEKTRLIAQHQIALDHLHVCWRTWDDTNCSLCEKCLRTMVALELFGALDRAPTFTADRVDPKLYRHVKANSPPGVEHYLIELKNLAHEFGRRDFEEEIDRCHRRGRKYGMMRNLVPDVIGGPNGVLGKPLRAIWKRI